MSLTIRPITKVSNRLRRILATNIGAAPPPGVRLNPFAPAMAVGGGLGLVGLGLSNADMWRSTPRTVEYFEPSIDNLLSDTADYRNRTTDARNEITALRNRPYEEAADRAFKEAADAASLMSSGYGGYSKVSNPLRQLMRSGGTAKADAARIAQEAAADAYRMNRRRNLKRLFGASAGAGLLGAGITHGAAIQAFGDNAWLENQALGDNLNAMNEYLGLQDELHAARDDERLRRQAIRNESSTHKFNTDRDAWRRAVNSYPSGPKVGS